MKLYIVTAVILCIIYVEAKNFAEDYCWRDFNGAIPSDAFSTGIDKNGKPVYIGQVLFQDKLINGKIVSDKNVIYFDWLGREYTKDKNVKIFCTDQPEKFEWVATTYLEVTDIMHKNTLVQGGFDDVDTYIGRVVVSEDKKNLGRVITEDLECYELYTTNNGHVKAYRAFEILTYNPNIKSTDNVTFPIDVRNTV